MLAASGLPAGRGRKGGVPKRKRSNSHVVPEIFVPRPGTSKPQQGNRSSIASPPVSIVVPSSSNPLISPVVSCSFENVGSLGPLVSQTVNLPSYLPPNTNPFYVRLIEGNIRMCQGCKTSLRNANGSIPLPPYDLAVARYERRCYRDKTGELQTPQREQAVHYHIKVPCIKNSCDDFVPSSLTLPVDIWPKLRVVKAGIGICR